ncbi:hypothetical protein Lalb_Chr02g0147501 [Lupinus albus]|uniref:Uncharacterized protein n=1 Tax=Lupinus albus TaxID=3870 RepID=A0A6A4QWZ4_LUPAL|nr:hypothetical protein Lalb_Chr02g0147501 [Lupinus albus]
MQSRISFAPYPEMGKSSDIARALSHVREWESNFPNTVLAYAFVSNRILCIVE